MSVRRWLQKAPFGLVRVRHQGEPLNRPLSIEARSAVKAVRFRALRVQLAPRWGT